VSALLEMATGRRCCCHRSLPMIWGALYILADAQWDAYTQVPINQAYLTSRCGAFARSWLLCLRLREALHVGHSTWDMSAMKSIRWLAVVASLAIALAVIRAVLGESLVGVAMFFVVAMLVVQYVLGGSNWFRAVVAGLVAMAAYTMYSRLLPADTVTKQVGVVALLLALATPFVVHFIRDRSRSHHHS
jgi:hypothetical protein